MSEMISKLSYGEFLNASVSASAKILFLHMIEFNEKGILSSLGCSDLAVKIGVARRSISDWTRELCEAGWVSQSYRGRNGNSYSVCNCGWVTNEVNSSQATTRHRYNPSFSS